MTSEKQILANRLNAVLGGVKTEAGKATVRLNAVSQGFFSKAVLAPGEDPSVMEAFRDSIMAELQPVGELETLLVEIILTSTWKLVRVLKSERKYPQKRLDYRDSDYQNVMRYSTTLERQVYKALHELEIRQKARQDKELLEISTLASGISFSQSETGGRKLPTAPPRGKKPIL